MLGEYKGEYFKVIEGPFRIGIWRVPMISSKCKCRAGGYVIDVERRLKLPACLEVTAMGSHHGVLACMQS